MRIESQPRAEERKRLLRAARRIIIKVGTSTVTAEDGALSKERVVPIVEGIAGMLEEGRQVVLVSSGAVGLGRGTLGLHPARLKDLVTKQACAAAGQSLLMHAYQEMFSAHEVKIAQILVTEEDFAVRQRYANVRRTMEKLLGFGVLPIVNENDTVSTAEIEPLGAGKRSAAFSDNDRLAALVMSGLEADALVLLTNVDGLLCGAARPRSGTPENHELPELLPVVREITLELRSIAAGPSAGGRGGMSTKLEAAEIAMNCGGVTVIANGQDPEILPKIFRGDEVGTAFLPAGRMRGKRRWLTYAAEVRGSVRVDPGTQKALAETKASLLASGVVRVDKAFDREDVVSIMDESGNEFARGIAGCGSHELKDREYSAGRGNSRVLITRDNIVLLRSK
jgi:glutamate 5-kinase